MSDENWPAHPEIAIGIPPMVVTARYAFKRKWADLCGYDGPLTLEEAVKQGRIAAERAEALVRTWERASHKQYGEMPAPRVRSEPSAHPDVKPQEVA